MKKSRLLNLILMLAVVFCISALYTLIDNYQNLQSVYEMGFLTGHIFRNSLQNLAIFAIIYSRYKNFNGNHRTRNYVFILIAILIFSAFYTFVDVHTIYDNAYQQGFSFGRFLRHVLNNVIMVYVIILIFRKNKTKILNPSR